MESGGNKVLYQLSKVINTDDISPSFGESGIKLAHPETFFRGLRVRHCYGSYDRQKQRNVVKREELKRWGDFKPENVYLKSTPTSSKVDHFLHETVGSFITIEVMDEDAIEKEYLNNPVKSANLSPAYLDACLLVKDQILAHIKTSASTKQYDTIDVPADYGKQFEEVEKKDAVVAMTAAQRRKALGKLAIHVMVPNGNYWNGRGDTRPFTFS